MNIKVALADDEALIRKGLKLLIDDFEGMNVVLEASNGIELIEGIKKLPVLPDILLLDLKMPQLDGIDTTIYLQQTYDNIKIIILSTHFKESFVLHMTELGCSAYLPKKVEPIEFERAINEDHSSISLNLVLAENSAQSLSSN